MLSQPIAENCRHAAEVNRQYGELFGSQANPEANAK
jgi:hypothetical protein